jgi:DNA-binding transcriptional LysR family regulator
MEFRHLRYFIGVAEELNFSRAARHLNVSQPPLTQAIQQLEEELEVRLFNRTSRRVELTEAGTFFLSRARSILAQVNRTKLELGLQSQVKKEVLRVGFTRSISVLPVAMKAFRLRFPDVHLELLPSVNRSAKDFLMDDEADMNIGEYLTPDSHLDSKLWADLRLLAVMPITHPLAKRDRIGIRDLRNQPLLLPGLANPMHMGREALRFCRESGHFEPNLLRHCDDSEVLFSLIASEAGVGIVHGFQLGGTHHGLKSASFRELTPVLKVGIAWRRDRISSALLGLVEELAVKLQPFTNVPGSVYFNKSLYLKTKLK